MAGQLIFSEESLIDNNLFKYDQRLVSMTNRYIANGAILSTYWNIAENKTTVDRGTRDIDALFGKESPLRFNRIVDFPLYGFELQQVNNTDEGNFEDISSEGELIILPSTITPAPNDCFTLNHHRSNKIISVFRVMEISYDQMRVDGFYKIKYRLEGTSQELLDQLEQQTVENHHTDLYAIGTASNPIVREDDFIRRTKIEKMVNKMVEAYRALFYNERHNCFLFHDLKTGQRLFDLCGNEFMAKHSLINNPNSTKVILLHEKIRDANLPIYYNNSIYNWLELDAPQRLLQQFYYQLSYADGYTESSFARWGESDIMVMQPLTTYQTGLWNKEASFFDQAQLAAFSQKELSPTSEFDKLIWKFVTAPMSLSLQDISLYTADTLLNSVRHIDVFLYTPIVLYLIKRIMAMN